MADDIVCVDAAGDARARILATIDYALSVNASDIHLKPGTPPACRRAGRIFYVGQNPLLSDDIAAFIRESFGADVQGRSVDYSWEYRAVRFRCNAFCEMNGWSLSIRVLIIPSLDFAELGVPEILKNLCARKSGLILITGPTGSGKTTTLTCLINHLNTTRDCHIIMAEEPIEYVHHSARCIISQREIGTHVASYDAAIVDALREDPDIILIGEMREKESIEGALRAAETGHLVLSTLHTRGAANTITRIVDVFEPAAREQVKMQLSLSLLGVVSQQLIPRVDGQGCVLATETMLNTVPVQNAIRQEKIHTISQIIELGQKDGMVTMKKSLERLFAEGVISLEDFENYQIK